MSLVTIIMVSGLYYHSLSKAVEFVLNGPKEPFLEKIKEDEEYDGINSDIKSLIFEFEKIIFKDTKNFYDEEYLTKLESNIESEIIGFDIRRNNEIIWKSNIQDYDYDIVNYPEFGSFTLIQFSEYNELNDKENIKIIKQIDFYFSNGDVGIVYIFVKRDLVSIIRTNLFFSTLFISLFLVILLSLLNSLFIYRSISVPLTKLIDGVKKMKEIDYDFEFDINRKDEISSVAKSFDELRVELLESKKIRFEYEKDRKEFIDNITHDINTPITSASMNIDAILDGVINDNDKDKKERYLRNIKEKIKVISELVDELSLISDMDLNKGKIEFETVEIRNFLKDIIEEFQYEKKYDNVEILYNDEIGKHSKEIDIEKLRRVILNIIENSIKYSNKENIKIYISSKKVDDKLIISIEDNGPGVKNNYSNIFKRFYREDESRNSEITGSGLGLSIASKIIEIHNGEIYAEKATRFDSGLKINIILWVNK
jgi:histidine kinase